jgi:hypothetical protein
MRQHTRFAELAILNPEGDDTVEIVPLRQLLGVIGWLLLRLARRPSAVLAHRIGSAPR